MSDPPRAARLWLAVAVATLWLLSVGSMTEDTLPVSTLPPLADADGPASRPRQATQLRLVSIFRQAGLQSGGLAQSASSPTGSLRAGAMAAKK